MAISPFRSLLRLSTLICLLFLITGAAFAQKSFVIQGKVGDVISATQFQVETDTITCGPATVLTLSYGAEKVTLPFEQEALRPGMLVSVKGKRDAATGQILADSITAVVYEVSAATTDAGSAAVKGTALIEKPPALTKINDEWSGIVFADGRKIKFTKYTKISFAPNHSERAKSSAKPVSSITSVGEVGPNVFVRYEGWPYGKGTVIARRLVFMRNEDTPQKAKLRQQYEPTVTEPDYTEGKPGTLVIKSLHQLRIVPSKVLQEKVNEIGLRLVPAFQKSLPDTDPLKIHFHFYVVDTEAFGLRTFPSGAVVISAALVSRLENEAQLAAVLSADMALVTQEPIYELYRQAKPRGVIGLTTLAASAVPFAVVPGLGLVGGAVYYANCGSYTELVWAAQQQAGRKTLEYMVDAGYDPSEARKSSKLSTKS